MRSARSHTHFAVRILPSGPGASSPPVALFHSGFLIPDVRIPSGMRTQLQDPNLPWHNLQLSAPPQSSSNPPFIVPLPGKPFIVPLPSRPFIVPLPGTPVPAPAPPPARVPRPPPPPPPPPRAPTPPWDPADDLLDEMDPEGELPPEDLDHVWL
jgi:hypothetical protein